MEMDPSVAIFIGLILTAVGGFSATRLQNQHQIEYEGQLRMRSDEIADLNREIAGRVTGGDGYCYFEISRAPKGDDLFLVLAPHGKYPLYDVEFRLVDVQLFEQIADDIEAGDFEKLSESEIKRHIGTLPPKQARMQGRLWLPSDRDYYAYNVFMGARNGFFSQIIRLRLVNGKWKCATKVFGGGGEDAELIFEHAEPDFPLDAAGEPRW